MVPCASPGGAKIWRFAPCSCWKCIMVKKRWFVRVVRFFTWGVCTVSTNEKEAMLIKNHTMVRTRHCGSIGAIGLAKASLFHPWEHICKKYPNNYHTRCLENFSIIRDGMAHVNRHNQWCYFMNINRINHVLHIVTKNFHLDVPPVIIFDTMIQQTNPSNPPQDDMTNKFVAHKKHCGQY